MKKSLSLILAVIMLLSSCGFALAADSGKCDCGFSPVIYVGPLGCTPIVRDAGAETEQQLWKTDAGFLLSNAGDILGTVGKAALTGNCELLGDALVSFVKASFGDLALDNDGNSQPNVTTPDLNVPEDPEHGIDRDYYFDYDFRLDPYAHARRLHDFIERVKELTGHDSVKLKCSSMGGVVLAAYLDLYGYEGIDVIICRCCPLWGTAVAGELFTGKLSLNAEALRRYGEDAIPFLETGFADDLIEAALYNLLETLRYTGILNAIVALGDKLIEKLGERIYNEALIPIFGTMPGIWSFVPAEYYDEALEFMGVRKDGGLYRQIEAYRAAQANIAKNLTVARENGVVVCLTCGYNVQRTPLVSLWKSTSDGTVDTKYASMGAVCGDTKEALPDEYISAVTDKTYLSPDNMIDASGCALRDCTWFFRDWLHCNGNAAVDEFYRLVMTSDEVSVTSFEQYPQFMQIDDNAETLTPVTGAPDSAARFCKYPGLLNLIRMLFDLLEKCRSFVFAPPLIQP